MEAGVLEVTHSPYLRLLWQSADGDFNGIEKPPSYPFTRLTHLPAELNGHVRLEERGLTRHPAHFRLISAATLSQIARMVCDE